MTFSVFDTDPVKLIHARSLGFEVASKERLLQESEVIISVTGNKALADSDLANVKDCSVIASVTSADDEFDFSECIYTNLVPCSHVIEVIMVEGKRIFLINRGNAVNFAFDPNVGASITLLQGEIIMCIHSLLTSDGKPVERELSISDLDRRDIASLWLKQYLREFA